MTDDWDENAPGPRSPLVFVLGACALMVVGALAAPLFLGHEPLLPLLGGGAAIGIALWLVSLIVAMRGASLLWKLGSLLLLAGIGTAAGLAIHVRDQGGVRRDLGTVAEMEIAANGIVTFPSAAASRGPLSKLLVEANAADIAERKAFGDAAGQLGLANLNSSYNLARDPGVLGQCGEIAGLKTLVAEARRNRQARHAGVVAAAGRLGQPPEIVRAIGETLAPTDDAEKLDGLSRAMNEGIDAAQAQCTALARRAWSDNAGAFDWSSGADRAAYDSAQERKRKSASDQAEIEREALAKALAAQGVVQERLK